MTKAKRNVRLETAQSYNPAITEADIAAFYAGWEASCGGLSSEQNPHPASTTDRLAWGAGFAGAKECAERERTEHDDDSPSLDEMEAIAKQLGPDAPNEQLLETVRNNPKALRELDRLRIWGEIKAANQILRDRLDDDPLLALTLIKTVGWLK
jgi:hypothetical protein